MTARSGARAGMALGLVLVIVVALIWLAGANPLHALSGLIQGTLGDSYVIAETLVTAAPLAIVALGVMPALRAGVFTIGSEGQLVIGAMVSTAVTLSMPSSGPESLFIGILAGMAGGMLWALLPALLRAYLHVNEILSTLLLNYIAGHLLLMVLNGPLKANAQIATPRSDPWPAAAHLPYLLDGTRLHAGVLLVLALLVAAMIWTRTASGLRYQLHASHPELSSRLGLSEPRAVITTMLVAGAAAGAAGWMQVSGLTHTLYPSVGGGLGFTGILVALLGGLNPVGIVAAAVVLGALDTGAQGMQIGTSVPASIAEVIQGLLLLAVALVVAGRSLKSPGSRQSPAKPERAAQTREATP